MESGVPIEKLLLSKTHRKVTRHPRSTPYASSHPFKIQALPVEIRLSIFREYVLTTSNETANSATSALVNALRPCPELYNEILEVFYSLNYCAVSLRNRSKALLMLRSVLKRSSLLRVWYGPRSRREKTAEGDGGDNIVSYCPNVMIEGCSNVRTLHVTTDADETIGLNPLSDWDERLTAIIKQFVLNLPSLEKLIVDVRDETCMVTGDDDHGKKMQMVRYPTLQINEATGIRHEWYRPDEIKGITSIAWTAPKGHKIRWTDEDHCESLPWDQITAVSYCVGALLHRRLFSSRQHLHFLGLNPRMVFHACQKKAYRCEELTAVKLPTLDPDGLDDWRKLNPVPDDEQDQEIYWRPTTKPINEANSAVPVSMIGLMTRLHAAGVVSVVSRGN